MAKALQPSTTYNQLVTILRQEIQHTKLDMERRLVFTYWNMGKRIDAYLGKDHPHGALAALARRLAEDVGICQRTIEHCHQFFVTYPKLDPGLPINWSHYRHLITIENKSRRNLLAKRIVREELSTIELKALIHTPRKSSASGQCLNDPARGLLYYYRIIKAASDNWEAGGFMVDCGFANSIVPPPAGFTIVNKRIVSSIKEDGAYRIISTDVAKERIFTYKALIERIIDADTFLANIDCGFGLWTRQRLRLSGIDAPEKRTAAGINALNWVKARLAKCRFVVIRTYKSDKYDRYLADVFYAARKKDPQAVADNGVYLNGELVARRLAKVWGTTEP